MKINPIIEEFSKTETAILEIVNKNFKKDQFLENTLQKLLSGIFKGQLNDVSFEEIDKAIVVGHPDSELFLLFVSYAINYYVLLMQFEKGNTVASIASSLFSKKNDPTVQALYFQTLAKLHYELNNEPGCKENLIKLMALVKPGHPRFNQFQLNSMNMLGGMGQLNEIGEFNEIVPKSFVTKFHKISYFTAIISNCINNGDYSLGLKAISEFKLKYPNDKKLEIEQSEASLKVISGDFNENIHPDILFKYYVKTCFHLSIGDTETARNQLKMLIAEIKTSNHYFIGNLPLHIELSLGNIGKVKFDLYERKKKGNYHYLDDLFYGRLHLLENNFLKADQSFSQLMVNIRKYGARNRLIFELNFAKEMRLFDKFRLLNGWNESQVGLASKAISKTKEKQSKLNIGVDLLIGQTEEIMRIKNQIKKYSKLNDIVLVTGETGTGKELIAKAIHEEGPFPKEPFLAINCGALTDNLLQSELFGYVAGAFTGAMKERKGIFESAGKGTVFLDEFGDISPKLQVSLLRVLESNEIRLLGDTVTRKIQCKIVIATNVDLHKAVNENRFREDLFFRLARFEIKLPALRERTSDLPLLIQFFLDKNTDTEENRKIISNDLLKELSRYQWPGNIRELKNEIDRLSILNPEVKVLGIEHFDFAHLQGVHQKIKSESNIIPTSTANSTKTAEPFTHIIENGFRVERRIEFLKDLFRKHKKLTRKQIVEITKVGQSTATKDLQKLCEVGYLIRKSPTKSPSTDYFEYNNV
jgi:transcriptional regulator with PAS, ATPase and Fis domain